jgi:ABC-type multidrug transport system ATPase subunit
MSIGKDLNVLISADHLCLKRKEIVLIKDFNLQLKFSEIVFLLGANGSGKSTLLQTLAGLHLDFSGGLQVSKMVWLPQSLSRPNDLSVGDFIGSHFEDDFCFENKDYFGVEKLKGKFLEELSGGQWQKVLLSVCLATKASVYLLDEPTNNLDAEGMIELAGIIKTKIVDGKKSFVIASHDLAFVDTCEGFMDGKIKDRVVLNP